MQYTASLLTILSLTATSFAAPPTNFQELEAAPSPLPKLPVPVAAPNLASPFSTANGAIAKLHATQRDIGVLGSLTTVAAPVSKAVAVAADVSVGTDLISIADVSSSVQTIKATVVSDVVSIYAHVLAVGASPADQNALAAEIIKDLVDIKFALQNAAGSFMAKSLPTVVDIEATAAAGVVAILTDVEEIVLEIVQVLTGILAGLVDSTYALVMNEATEVYKLLNPVLTPILSFVSLVKCDAEPILMQEVSLAVTGILGSSNGLLAAKGLVPIAL